MHGITLEYTQDRQFLYAKIKPRGLRQALATQESFECLLFEALEAIQFSSFAYQLDMQQLDDLSHMPWHTLHQTLVRRIAVRTEFTLKVERSPDHMEASAQIKLAFADEKVSQEALYARLAENGIVKGILPEALHKWVQNPQDDNTYKVALGQEPQKGLDETLIPLAKQVWVEAGEIVARHQAATPGEDGFDVLGNPLPAIKGKPNPFLLDKFCEYLDTQIRVKQTGILLITPHLICVSHPQRIVVQNYSSKELQALAELYESLHLVGDLKDCQLSTTGHLWIEGHCENVTLQAGGHLSISGELRGPSALQTGGSCWLSHVQESTLMVAQQLYAEHLHTTQAFVGQGFHGPRCENYQLFLHPPAHPFFSQEKQRLQASLRQINSRTKSCVQELIEARKANKESHVTHLLNTYHRLQRKNLFTQAALSGYAEAFDPAFTLQGPQAGQ